MTTAALPVVVVTRLIVVRTSIKTAITFPMPEGNIVVDAILTALLVPDVQRIMTATRVSSMQFALAVPVLRAVLVFVFRNIRKHVKSARAIA